MVVQCFSFTVWRLFIYVIQMRWFYSVIIVFHFLFLLLIEILSLAISLSFFLLLLTPLARYKFYRKSFTLRLRKSWTWYYLISEIILHYFWDAPWGKAKSALGDILESPKSFFLTNSNYNFLLLVLHKIGYWWVVRFFSRPLAGTYGFMSFLSKIEDLNSQGYPVKLNSNRFWSLYQLFVMGVKVTPYENHVSDVVLDLM